MALNYCPKCINAKKKVNYLKKCNKMQRHNLSNTSKMDTLTEKQIKNIF